ncbi:pyridoxal phosphate-dependent transferase [Thermothelomyces heterothallicus CBS 202.75]|uniref:pyridoxal phosphate-dependent transferase n=1 Tax=Thermothelomyces heterothallicus CBS 202.75 TaxID=1149848 RepID=UPI0037427D72
MAHPPTTDPANTTDVPISTNTTGTPAAMNNPNPETETTDPETDFLLQSYIRLRHALSTKTHRGDDDDDDDGQHHHHRHQQPSDPRPVLPTRAALAAALSSLPTRGSPSYLAGRGAAQTHAHLLAAVLPALNAQALSPRYYGFVTGGVLPVAEAADNLVTALDQNVQVHFPLPPGPGRGSGPGSGSGSGAHEEEEEEEEEEEGPGWTHSASTAVEDAALRMLIDLLHLDGEDDEGKGARTPRWPGRTFTTGATASNVLGLACGREAVVNARAARAGGKTVAGDGLLAACLAGGVREVQVLTSMGHSSLAKAASLVGLGHGSIKDVGLPGEPWRLDLDAVERELKREDEGVLSIVVVSAGEVNTGRFATNVLDMPKLRSLADRYGAWIHVDGAFGLFARALPKTDEFLRLHANVAGLELADSIAADGHKLLNVPYDNGIFLCQHASVLTQVCSNPNAAYLAAPGDPNAILSPLDIGIENSRRFRALPVYAVLLSEGREGIAAMLSRMVLLAREIAAFVRDSEHYEWLPTEEASLESTYIIVLFRAKDPELNEVLVDRINASGRMFVSGTKWEGKKAVRIAVASWRVDVERDAAVVKEVLTAIAVGRKC